MPRRELEDIVRNCRKVHYEGKRVGVNALSWTHAGAVWAMDYTAPPKIVEERFRTILAVRDLASGNLLLALPARPKTPPEPRSTPCALCSPSTARRW